MLKTERILIASHDTVGARAAEEAALFLCTKGATLLHLVVVPDLWRGMMGDDWLNNVSTREVYCKHIESQLGAEIDRHRLRLEPLAAARGASYQLSVAIGKPAECLLEYSAQTNPGLVVIGSPRPPRSPGLRSRMQVEPLVKTLSAPLLVIPYPQ